MTTIITPLDLSTAERTGKRTFRKQILKKGVINYKGQRIKFDDKMLAELSKNFKKGAYDQVPFVLADEANHHNEDPEKFRGELTSVELTDDGLDGIFTLTPAGAKVVKNNPRLGVSARIMAAVEHSDGRSFGRSIRHVLATMNPRVTGMKPWEAVTDLSEEDEDEVVDLTAETYEEGSQMATKNKAKGKPASGVVSVKTAKGEIDLSTLTDEEFQSLLDLAAEMDEADDEDTDEDGDDAEDEDSDDEDDDSDEDDEDGDDEDEEETNLSAEDESGVTEFDPATDLPKVKGKKAKGKTKTKKKAAPVSLSVEERMAQGEWRRERREFARAGVPPHLLDLAQPVLSKPQAVMVDLSNDESVDATSIIRDMLESAKGYIEIKPEIGHQVDLSADDEPADSTTTFLQAWDTEYGKA